MYAIHFEEQGDNDTASNYMSSALKVLDKAAQSGRGGARQVPNVHRTGPNVSAIRSFR